MVQVFSGQESEIIWINQVKTIGTCDLCLLKDPQHRYNFFRAHVIWVIRRTLNLFPTLKKVTMHNLRFGNPVHQISLRIRSSSTYSGGRATCHHTGLA